MNRAQARAAVHLLIRHWLDEPVDFDDQSGLSELGLDRDDIEALLWRLEDRFDLGVLPREEQRALGQLERVDDLVQWLLEKARQNED
ncbi:acyl carrier protein [Pseudomonas protegens]|uniref:acyl carrier protein n=1 Tax=Pseudomonas protegens TaxID=380021 RepID=UPI00380A7A96